MSYRATLDNTTGYTQADLNRYNAALERHLETLDTDDADAVGEAAKRFADRHLTDAPSEWLF